MTKLKAFVNSTPKSFASTVPFPASTTSMASPMTADRSGLLPAGTLNAFDPESGKMLHSIDVAAHAGTAFDGEHLFQLAEDRIQKIDPKTGRVVATIPAPGGGGDSGLAWAEGTLWVGQYRERKIHQIDPETGAIIRTIESNRFVTGVTWVDGELWHGTWEGDERREAHRPSNRRSARTVEMPSGVGVSGLESDGDQRFFCGGGKSGKIESRAPARTRQAMIELATAWRHGGIHTPRYRGTEKSGGAFRTSAVSEARTAPDWCHWIGKTRRRQRRSGAEPSTGHVIGADERPSIPVTFTRESSRRGCWRAPSLSDMFRSRR